MNSFGPVTCYHNIENSGMFDKILILNYRTSGYSDIMNLSYTPENLIHKISYGKTSCAIQPSLKVEKNPLVSVLFRRLKMYVLNVERGKKFRK